MKLRDNHLLYSNRQLIMPMSNQNSFKEQETMIQQVSELDSPEIVAGKPPLGNSKTTQLSKEQESQNNKTQSSGTRYNDF